MLMKMRSRMQNQKGFTLVELMVVVVILGILVAIAIPVYSNVSKNAKIRACESNERIIKGAVEMFVAGGGDRTEIDDVDDLSTYIQETPVCPYEDDYEIEDGVLTEHDHSGETE